MGKLVFLLFFIPAHVILTLVTLEPSLTPPPGLAATAWHAARRLLLLPIILPLLLFDSDGDWLPRWLQWLALVVNSAIWGVALIAAWTAVRWLYVQLGARDGRAGD